MPLIDKKEIGMDIDIFISNDEFSKVYWKEISDNIKSRYFSNKEEESEYNIVQKILREMYSFFCNKLDELIKQENRHSFYLYCINLHENSNIIYNKIRFEKYCPLFNEEHFSVTRRVLKIIIEQSVKYNLRGSSNIEIEIENNKKQYNDYLERLLYVGKFAMYVSEYIARSTLFNKSIGIRYDRNDDVIELFPYFPYDKIFEKIYLDYHNHDKDVAPSKSFFRFKEFVESEYKVSVNDLNNFSHYIKNNKNIHLEKSFDTVVKKIKEENKASSIFIDNYFKGLILSKDNVLSIEQSIYKTLNINRYMYKPILKYIINGKNYYHIGLEQWRESILQLTTNCIPFNVVPEEWKRDKKLSKLFNNIYNTHDKDLQEPIVKILEDFAYSYEMDIESFCTISKNNINIKDDIGDIDILFIDTEQSTIYICECKNLRIKYDYKEYKNDYTKLQEYESQLERKINWASENKKIIQEHFKLRPNNPINIDILNYKVEGIFIINSVTIYMYNGRYKCYTIYNFRRMLKGENVFEEIDLEYKGKDYIIEYPYFDNAEKILF
jgi:hypothetical protein